MLNFDTELDEPTVTEVQIIVPVVAATVSVEPVSPPPSPVSWEAVRDYVIDQIVRMSGPVPRSSKMENTIFRAYVERWGILAMPIAQYVFEECGGTWMNAPVGVHRFHRTADSYFAQRIAETLMN